MERSDFFGDAPLAMLPVSEERDEWSPWKTLPATHSYFRIVRSARTPDFHLPPMRFARSCDSSPLPQQHEGALVDCVESGGTFTLPARLRWFNAPSEDGHYIAKPGAPIERFNVEVVLRRGVRRVTAEHVRSLIDPYGKYIVDVEFSSRGGHFVSLLCTEPLQGLKALHALLVHVNEGSSSQVASCAIVHHPFVDGAPLLESPRDYDFVGEEFIVPTDEDDPFNATTTPRLARRNTLFCAEGDVAPTDGTPSSKRKAARERIMRALDKAKGASGSPFESSLGGSEMSAQSLSLPPAVTPPPSALEPRGELDEHQSPDSKPENVTITFNSPKQNALETPPKSPQRRALVVAGGITLDTVDVEKETRAINALLSSVSQRERVAVVVSVSAFASPFFDTLGIADDDASALYQGLRELGFEVVMMEPKSPDPYLRPTVGRVKRLYEAFLRSVPHNTATLGLFILTRGYSGEIQGLDGSWEVALGMDSPAALLTDKNVLLPAQLATMTDKWGRHHLVFVDTWPAPQVPIRNKNVPSTPLKCYCWLTNGKQDDGGNEMLAAYPHNAGGVATYYLKKALHGRAFSGDEAKLELSMNSLIWFLEPRLFARNCSVQHNATLVRQNSVLRPLFTFKPAKTVADFKALLDFESLKEADDAVRFNVQMLVNLGPDAGPASVFSDRIRFVQSLTRTLVSLLYPTRSSKRIFNAKFRSAKRSSAHRIRVVWCVARKCIVYVQYKECQSLICEQSRTAAFLRDFVALAERVQKTTPSATSPSFALRNCLANGFAVLDMPPVNQKPIVEYLCSAMLTTTAPGATPVVMYKKPLRVCAVVDVSLSGTKREMRKLDRALRLQPITNIGVVLSVEKDPFDTEDHEVATVIQSLARGFIVRQTIRSQRLVQDEEQLFRMNVLREEAICGSQLFTFLLGQVLLLTIRHESFLRKEVESMESEMRAGLVVYGIRFHKQFEKIDRREIVTAEESEWEPIQEASSRLNSMSHMMRIWHLLLAQHWLLTGAMWNRFYVEMEAYQQFILARLWFKDSHPEWRCRVGPMLLRPIPPSTDFAAAHTCIHSLRKSAKIVGMRPETVAPEGSMLREDAPKEALERLLASNDTS